MSGRRHPRNKNWQRKRDRLFKRQKGKCYWCKKDMHKGKEKNMPKHDLVTNDHLIPWGEGGTHHISNLVAACWLCNQKRAWEQIKRKSSRDIDHNAKE